MESISMALGVPGSSVDYEFQDGGKFLLFTVKDASQALSSESKRALVYRNIRLLLKDLDIKWMLVTMDERGEVVDEINSLTDR